MESRTKCDVIPEWMFKHLEGSARYIVKQEKSKLAGDERTELKQLKKEKEEIAWSLVQGKTIGECFYYDGYNIFCLNKDIKDKIDTHKKIMEHKINEKIQTKNGRIRGKIR